jgi:hypothetical protein
VPVPAVSVWPTCGVPEIVGGALFAGAALVAAEPAAAATEAATTASAENSTTSGLGERRPRPR